jgi:hypothetical protein
VPAARPVIDYRRPTTSDDPASAALRYVREALLFLGLLGFAVGCFGGFVGNVVPIPDDQRSLGALVVLSCGIGYVVLRAINATPRMADRLAMSLSAGGAIGGAAFACAFRFPHRPLQNPGMLAVGLAVLIVALMVFVVTRSDVRRREGQSFEK